MAYPEKRSHPSEIIGSLLEKADVRGYVTSEDIIELFPDSSDDLEKIGNIILALQVMKGFFRPLSRKQAEEFSNQYIQKLSIKTPSINTPIASLSGGNQQKVILARWLLTHPMYLILDEPTRGIDVGTKVEIQKLVLGLAEEGMSLTFISSEIDEMLRTCSRMIVMKDREIVGELSGMDVTEHDVMHMIARGGE